MTTETKTTEAITLTSGEKVEATKIAENIYRLPAGRMIRTWTEDGEVLQDPEAADVDCLTDDEASEDWPT